jgi:diacylglycerol kinase (ATP)
MVIFNPEAGLANPDVIQRKINSYLTGYQIPFQMHVTNPQEKISQFVREAGTNGYDLILAAGGDGTVSQVANGIAGSPLPMAILPNGTGNIIAKDLQIPLRLVDALDLVFKLEHKAISLDAMKVHQNFYILIVSAGFSAHIFESMRREEKKRLGIFSYPVRGMMQLAGIQPTRFTLIVDGRKLRFAGSDVLVTNSAIIGWRPLKLDPDARMDDGRLSVCVLRTRNLFDYIHIAWELLAQRQRVARELKIVDVERQVEIHARRKLLVQGDGDVIGKTPVLVEFVPHLIRCIVPMSYDEAS